MLCNAGSQVSDFLPPPLPTPSPPPCMFQIARQKPAFRSSFLVQHPTSKAIWFPVAHRMFRILRQASMMRAMQPFDWPVTTPHYLCMIITQKVGTCHYVPRLLNRRFWALYFGEKIIIMGNLIDICEGPAGFLEILWISSSEYINLAKKLFKSQWRRVARHSSGAV